MNGLMKGIGLIGLAINMRRRAQAMGNNSLVADLDAVFAQFASEVFGTTDLHATNVKINIGNILFGGDLFSGSRKLFQAVQQKYPGA